ncbi:nucleotidyltransferase domain-containing protein [Leucothrix pacifica]|nr:nucleotidyltransferase domain-containing protein [Leucothrix pacifica]
MSSHFANLTDRNMLPGAPKFLKSAIQYEVIMGSMAYGVSNDSSDMDVYGFAIPPKDYVFPQLRGEIPGFDSFSLKFEQYQQHHIVDPDALGGKGREYDFTIYSIVKYFRLLADNNPNIIDSLFVPDNCVLHSSDIGDMVRDNRRLFLHKGCWAKFKGYAYGQMHKIRTKKPKGKRKAGVEEFGYDLKFAYHVVRLLDEVEQLLVSHDMDLRRNAAQLKSIRRGEWSLLQLEDYFKQKEADLEKVYLASTLPDHADTDAIRQLLIDCLEQHFGSLGTVVTQSNAAELAMRDIQAILTRYQEKR